MSTGKNPGPEKLAELLHATAIRLLRTVRRMDDASGQTAPRLSALSVIVFSGPITLGQLAEAEQVRPPTMTRIVNALEQHQLVRKTKDASDGRTIRIVATMRGKKQLLRGRARRVQFLAERINLLEPAQQENLSAALFTIQRLIERGG